MQDKAWILWDLLAVAVVVYCIQKGVKFGLVRMVVSFACYIISTLIAREYSAPAAESIYRGAIEAPLKESIATRLEESLVNGFDASGLVEALPGWMKALAETLTDQEILKTVNLGLGAGKIADIVVEQVLYEPLVSLIQGIVFLLIFTVLSWLIHRLSRLLSGVYRIPVVGTINSVMGGIVGVLQAAVLLVAIGVMVQLMGTFFAGTAMWMNRDVIESTYIFRVFYGYILPQ